MKRDVTVNYWAAQSISDQFDTKFKEIQSEEKFWDYYNNTFANQLFTDMNMTQLLQTDSGYELLKNSYVVGSISF